MRQVLKKLFGAGKKDPLIISYREHKISATEISEEAMSIVKKLQDGGYVAYIVGGAVRDILLGFHPKDFDIATDAKPAEIQSLFRRRARIIGKRFPIVHIYAQRKRRNAYLEYTEITTFRGGNDNIDHKRYYGSPYEDANRRDFTINGIFYDPISRKIYDYVGGVADIEAKKLRMIGAAHKRLPEDPVRLLRALRLSTKLGLTMSVKLEKQLAATAPLLADIPSARLFDEMIKVINCGAGARIFDQWRQFGVCRHIMPMLKDDNPLFFSVMAENDRRLAEKRENSVSFVIAALFWQQTSEVWHALRKNGHSPMQAMEGAIAAVPFRQNFIIPQRLTAKAKDLYFLQAQMENAPTQRRARSILHNSIFERALAFASLRQDEGAAQTASWWSQFKQAGSEERERMLQSIPKTRRRNSRRRGRGRGKKDAPAL